LLIIFATVLLITELITLVHTKQSDVNDAAERTNGSWAAVCLHVVYMEELLNAYWTGLLLIYATFVCILF